MKLQMSLLQITIQEALKQQLTITARGWEDHHQSKVRKNTELRGKKKNIKKSILSVWQLVGSTTIFNPEENISA